MTDNEDDDGTIPRFDGNKLRITDPWYEIGLPRTELRFRGCSYWVEAPGFMLFALEVADRTLPRIEVDEMARRYAITLTVHTEERGKGEVKLYENGQWVGPEEKS